MLVREFEGKTQKEAVKLALETLKLKEDKVKIETINLEEKVSFFGFRSRKPVKIKVFYEEDKSNEIGYKVRNYLVDLIDIMDIKANIKIIKETKDKIYINIFSKESALLIGKQGRTLEALQFLADVNNISNSKNNNLPIKKVIIDIEGYLNRRKDKIKQLALKMADLVRNSKKSILLDPMNPFERHLVHMSLQDFSDIKTRSEGEGIYKKIRISIK